jgi:hypothetical protein
LSVRRRSARGRPARKGFRATREVWPASTDRRDVASQETRREPNPNEEGLGEELLRRRAIAKDPPSRPQAKRKHTGCARQLVAPELAYPRRVGPREKEAKEGGESQAHGRDGLERLRPLLSGGDQGGVRSARRANCSLPSCGRSGGRADRPGARESADGRELIEALPSKNVGCSCGALVYTRYPKPLAARNRLPGRDRGRDRYGRTATVPGRLQLPRRPSRGLSRVGLPLFTICRREGACPEVGLWEVLCPC